MTDNKWDDSKMEELLRAMPDLQDNRPESDILARLKQDERLQVPRRKKQKRWIPVLVAMAALLMIGILIPSMLRQNEGAMMKDASKQMVTSESSDISVQDHTAEESILFGEETEDNEVTAFSTMRMGVVSHVVLPDDLIGMHPFRIGLTQEANSIPVTFLLSDQRIMSEIPDEAPDSVSLYRRYAAEIPETDLGFDEYHPYLGELTVVDDTIIHHVPAKHTYDLASATLEMYYQSIENTFTDHAKFKTVDEHGELANFSHVGKTGVVNLDHGKRPLPYYKYVMPSGKTFLIPYAAGTTETVEQALLEMKKAHNDIVETVVPLTITYDVREEDGVAVITFDTPLDLLALEPDEATAMIEGFMLTASNYNKQVRFEKCLQDHFGRYDLTTALPEPVGVNPIPFPE